MHEQDAETFTDLSPTKLIEHALINQEGYLADSGALCTATGQRTDSSPQDRFIVSEKSSREAIDWGPDHRAFDAKRFAQLWDRVEDHVEQHDHYVAHLEVGDHPDHYIPVKVTTETAWHCLFAHNILVRPEQYNNRGKQKWRVLHAANFVCQPQRDGTPSDAAVIIHFAQRKILIAGMRYAGELKQALFTVQNFLLPEKDVLPLRCAANVGDQGDATLFLGLSGTGKTTLSADPKRFLLGDDEHGWAKDTVFNLEGGCYAKTLNLSRENEPVIWQAIGFGAIVENVIHDPGSREADYADAQLSENGRCCYNLTHVAKRIMPGRGGEPNILILLTCDVLGVLPPVARLSREAAIYHFLSGYGCTYDSTTNQGSKNAANADIQPVFSACFGAPFMPRPARDYADLLRRRIASFGSEVYLVNTGWSGGNGGPQGTGKRISMRTSRRIVKAIQSGELRNATYQTLPVLNLSIPAAVPGLDPALLNPRENWPDKAAYDAQAQRLARLFADNMAQHAVSSEIVLAGPQPDPAQG